MKEQRVMPSSLVRRLNQASQILSSRELNPAVQTAILAQVCTLLVPNAESYSKKLGIQPNAFRSIVREVYKQEPLRDLGREIVRGIRAREKGEI